MWWEVPGHLEVKNGELFIAGKSAADIAKKNGTPIYVYNTKRVVDTYRKFYGIMKKHSSREVGVHYAIKANFNMKILQLLNKEGAGIDATSPDEAQRALEAGFPKEKVFFTGTSVSNQDLKALVEMGARINIDSVSELLRLRKITPSKMDISMRMDPGVAGAGHHWKVVTAGREAHGLPIKFSIPENEVVDTAQLAEKNKFNMVGLHEHIGTNWRSNEDIDEFLKTVDVVIEKAKQVTKAVGHDLEFLNFGGGPGVRYMESHPEFPLDRYAEEINRRIDKSGLNIDAIHFEPGRYLVADSGLFLTQVVDIKKRYGDIIVGVNTGFNHLVRPTMYGSYHEIINCTKAAAKANATVTVAGNLCETGDVLTPEPRKMPMPEEGDILALHNAGAYGYVMASNYNLRGLPKEIIL